MTRKELIEFLTEILGPLPEMVIKQIDKYIKMGLTYKEIARSAAYIFEVTCKVPKNSISQFGIGLVPSYVKEANEYYENIKRQQDKQAHQVINAATVSKREVQPQGRKKRKRGIDINEL